MKQAQATRVSPSPPSQLSSDIPGLLRRRPTVLGESNGSYDALLSSITAALKPRDIFDEIWVKDIVDCTWEAQRMRLYKVHLCSLKRPRALKDAFVHLGIAPPTAEQLAAKMANKSLEWTYPERV